MEPDTQIRRGIRWKLLVTMLGLIVGLLAVLSWIEISNSQALIERETDKRVEQQHKFLADLGQLEAKQLAADVGNLIAGAAFPSAAEVVTNATAKNTK